MVSKIQLSEKISRYPPEEFNQEVLQMFILEQRLGFQMFYFMKNDHRIVVKSRRCLEVL